MDAMEVPAPSPPASVPTGGNLLPQLLEERFASFWRRLVAAILDGVLLSIIGTVADIALSNTPLRYVPIVEVLYSVLFIAAGATPGMRALKVRVIDGQGNAPGVKRSIVRYIIPALSWLPWLIAFSTPGLALNVAVPIAIVLGAATFVIGLLDPLWMIWDPKKQTLHDKLASTFVLHLP